MVTSSHEAMHRFFRDRPQAHIPTIRGEYAASILLALSPTPTANHWRDLMKAMEMDDELRASMHEGAVGELVREFEDEARAAG
jgi:hypothetical protein